MTGQAIVRSDISAISLAEKCQITTTINHEFETGNHVRITDLGEVGPAADRGFPQINNKRYLITVSGTDTFLIRDPITSQYINSLYFTPYVSGGIVTLEQTVFVYEGE